MECLIERNKKFCNCSYGSCKRKYKCCECLQYHRKSDELPACFFNETFEKTYDRSIKNFKRMNEKQGKNKND